VDTPEGFVTKVAHCDGVKVVKIEDRADGLKRGRAWGGCIWGQISRTILDRDDYTGRQQAGQER